MLYFKLEISLYKVESSWQLKRQKNLFSRVCCRTLWWWWRGAFANAGGMPWTSFYKTKSNKQKTTKMSNQNHNWTRSDMWQYHSFPCCHSVARRVSSSWGRVWCSRAQLTRVAPWIWRTMIWKTTNWLAICLVDQCQNALTTNKYSANINTKNLLVIQHCHCFTKVWMASSHIFSNFLVFNVICFYFFFTFST